MYIKVSININFNVTSSIPSMASFAFTMNKNTMTSLASIVMKMFLEKQPYDNLALLQAGQMCSIFVDLVGKDSRPVKILPENYYTQATFKATFGVNFEEVLLNYFKIYAEKHDLDASFDDNLISLIQLMKFLIKNRGKDPEEYNIKDEFIAFCDTPYTKHLKEQMVNPFTVLEIGHGFRSPQESTYTYVGINHFVFSRRDTEYKIFFRY